MCCMCIVHYIVNYVLLKFQIMRGVLVDQLTYFVNPDRPLGASCRQDVCYIFLGDTWNSRAVFRG